MTFSKRLSAAVIALTPFLAHGAFDVVALGVQGGISSDNLTAYLIKSDQQTRYLGLDAGTTIGGIEKAVKLGSFPELDKSAIGESSRTGYVVNTLIPSYWISHAHLDHVAGLVIASPDSHFTTLYGSQATTDFISQHLFNWDIWPNLSDRGRAPQLGKFKIQAESMYHPFAIAGTGLTGIMYPLNHDGYPSSMLMVTYQNESFAFFGDTGSDKIQKTHDLFAVWQRLAEEIKNKRLRGMIIETSFDNAHPDKLLFGHLTPALLLAELQVLESLSGGKGALQGMKIMIGHIKPSLAGNRDPAQQIQAQLAAGNDMGITFIFPQQGERYHF